MRAQALASSWLSRMLLALALAVAGAPAFAQTAGDPPGRVARLDHVEGAVSFLPAGDDEWVDAPRNRPITRGDQLWTDRGARAELHLGPATLRLNGRTQLQFTELDDRRARLAVPQGQASLRVRRLPAGERLELASPNLVFRPTQPGSYRLDVDPAQDSTRITLLAGQGTVYGRNGQTLGLAAPQQLTFTGMDLTQRGAPAAPLRDDFDEWAAARDREAERSASARYMSRDIPGYQQLDAHGEWRTDPSYGPVWSPYVTVVGWAPYRYGHWEYIPPWGWTWIDDAPWGFAPFHYGRWVQISLRWYWVPGPIVARPVYAPALVAFVGGSSGHLLLSSRQPGVAWFPLAPGEAFRPAYRASPHYIERLNRHQHRPDGDRDRLYRYQRQPEAVTVVPREQFGSRRTVRGESRALAPAELERGRVVGAPRFAPERRRDESEIRRAPPDRIPPGWTPRQQRMESRAEEPRRERSGNRFEGRDEDARRAAPAQREQDERQRRAEQEQRRQQAQHDQQLRQQREQEQNLRRQQQLQGEQAMRERAQRQQRAEQEQAQRRQQSLHEQQLRQQREQEQNLRRQQQQQREQSLREQAERQQRAMQEQAQRQQQAQQQRQQREQEQSLRRDQAVREKAERQQRAAERQRQGEEQRRVHGERRQRAEAEDGRR